MRREDGRRFNVDVARAVLCRLRLTLMPKKPTRCGAAFSHGGACNARMHWDSAVVRVVFTLSQCLYTDLIGRHALHRRGQTASSTPAPTRSLLSDWRRGAPPFAPQTDLCGGTRTCKTRFFLRPLAPGALPLALYRPLPPPGHSSSHPQTPPRLTSAPLAFPSRAARASFIPKDFRNLRANQHVGARSERGAGRQGPPRVAQGRRRVPRPPAPRAFVSNLQDSTHHVRHRVGRSARARARGGGRGQSDDRAADAGPAKAMRAAHLLAAQQRRRVDGAAGHRRRPPGADPAREGPGGPAASGAAAAAAAAAASVSSQAPPRSRSRRDGRRPPPPRRRRFRRRPPLHGRAAPSTEWRSSAALANGGAAASARPAAPGGGAGAPLLSPPPRGLPSAPPSSTHATNGTGTGHGASGGAAAAAISGPVSAAAREAADAELSRQLFLDQQRALLESGQQQAAGSHGGEGGMERGGGHPSHLPPPDSDYDHYDTPLGLLPQGSSSSMATLHSSHSSMSLAEQTPPQQPRRSGIKRTYSDVSAFPPPPLHPHPPPPPLLSLSLPDRCFLPFAAATPHR